MQTWGETTCRHCGEPLTVPRLWHSVVPPKPSCPNHCERVTAPRTPRPTQPRPLAPTVPAGMSPAEIERLREMHRKGNS
jgi:hypothetical protein